MLKSMTACGRAVSSLNWGQIVVELSSVNRKSLEIAVSMPKELLRLEPAVRKKVAETVKRGYLQVKVSVSYSDQYPIDVVPNIALAKKIMLGWKELCLQLGLEISEKGLLDVLQQESSVMTYIQNDGDKETLINDLLTACSNALEQLVEMKEREGGELCNEITLHLDRFESALANVEGKESLVVERFRNRIWERLELFGVDAAAFEGQLVKEICLLAEKADITEEVARLRAHIKLMRSLLSDEDQPPGKRVEFLLQEMQREVSTLAAKAGDIAISHAAVEMRGELEKIREQVQNVE